MQEGKKNPVVHRTNYFFNSLQPRDSGFGNAGVGEPASTRPAVGLSFDPYSGGRVTQLTTSSGVGR